MFENDIVIELDYRPQLSHAIVFLLSTYLAFIFNLLLCSCQTSTVAIKSDADPGWKKLTFPVFAFISIFGSATA